MDLLKRENVQILSQAKDWQDAVRLAAQVLEADGYVEPKYKEEIIKNVERFGPYIIIAPQVALPHARPEQGVLKSQLAVTLFKQEVLFANGEKPAKLFITLAAADSSSHLQVLANVAELLQDEKRVEQILQSDTMEELYEYFA